MKCQRKNQVYTQINIIVSTPGNCRFDYIKHLFYVACVQAFTLSLSDELLPGVGLVCEHHKFFLLLCVKTNNIII